MPELKDKLALVTGGSRGIGRFIARALHEAGARVAITGRDENTLGATAEAIGSRCTAHVCDHRNPGAIRRMADSLQEALGLPDILVNNAGVMKSAPVVDMSLETWDQVLESNLRGVFLTTQAFLPSMIARGRGDIFMISSMSGKKGDPGGAAYAASKFGLQGFSQALNYEVRKHNIRVMVLNPSAVDTGADTDPARLGGRTLHAADIAATIVHLAQLPGRTLIRDMDIWGTNP